MAWLRFDDSTVRRCSSYIIAALRRSGLKIPLALPARPRRHRPRLPCSGSRWSWPAQDPAVALVLDDLHLFTERQVLDGLDYMLQERGPGLRLVVSSRIDPLLPVHAYDGCASYTSPNRDLLSVQTCGASPAGRPALFTLFTEQLRVA